MEGKTIKQIADELGVSKQAVHQKRKSRELSTALQSFTSTVDGVVYISVDGEKLIKAAFSGQTPVNEPTTVYGSVDGSVYGHVDALISMLRTELDHKDAQLEAKDKQIAELNARLADTTTALMTAQQTAQAAQALHAGTLRKQLTTGRRPPLWARLFPSRFSNDERNLDQ